MNAKELENNLIEAFKKAVELNDFDAIKELVDVRGDTIKYQDREDKLKETYIKITEIMKRYDYMYWERKNIMELLEV